MSLIVLPRTERTPLVVVCPSWEMTSTNEWTDDGRQSALSFTRSFADVVTDSQRMNLRRGPPPARPLCLANDDDDDVEKALTVGHSAVQSSYSKKRSPSSPPFSCLFSPFSYLAP